MLIQKVFHSTVLTSGGKQIGHRCIGALGTFINDVPYQGRQGGPKQPPKRDVIEQDKVGRQVRNDQKTRDVINERSLFMKATSNSLDHKPIICLFVLSIKFQIKRFNIKKCSNGVQKSKCIALSRFLLKVFCIPSLKSFNGPSEGNRKLPKFLNIRSPGHINTTILCVLNNFNFLWLIQDHYPP